ncbi:Hpt domain-containing protein [Elusimicrobiota bacterium]
MKYNDFIHSEKMLQLFSKEANEYIELYETSLVKLKEDILNEQLIQDINRAVHTIKSMSGTLEYNRLKQVSGELENIVIGISNGEIEVNEVLIDGFLKYSDTLRVLKEEALSGNEPAFDIEPVIEEIKKLSITR